ncbi:hypothetical protein COO60DRAFT_66341 [Scenedesmus sp. NREL 46B-D3]|nr:hypothetical protein COO60DRAFT_66341 [Scenedesmus sp. NREL 46B-D3]
MLGPGAVTLKAAARAAVAEAAAARELSEPALAGQLQDGSVKVRGVSKQLHQPGRTVWFASVYYRRAVVRQAFDTQLEAVCAYDLAQLALQRQGAGGRTVRLPAELYTPQQVDAWAQLLQHRLATWQLAAEHSAVDRPAGDRPAVRRVAAGAAAAVAAAVAAARARDPDTAQQLQDGSLKPAGSYRQRHFTKSGPCWRWCMQLRVGAVRASRSYGSPLEAACAYDLAQLALYGPAVAAGRFNFAAYVYEQQQVDAMAELLWQKRPSWQVAAQQAEGGLPAERAARQAVQEAAAGSSSSSAAWRTSCGGAAGSSCRQGPVCCTYERHQMAAMAHECTLLQRAVHQRI